MKNTMNENYRKRVMLLAVKAGTIMMKSGAEIYRVEETITRICQACGIEYVNVFAMPTGIFVSVDDDKGSDNTVAQIKRISSSETNLNKISQVNDFSRKFTTTDMTLEEGEKILDEIDKGKKLPFWSRVLGASAVASCFSVLFGGGAIDFLCAFIIGAFSYTLSRFLEKYEINFFIRGMVCTGFAAFAALVLAASIHGAEYVHIITGCIMLFVPGVPITNSIRDFLSGDMVSGLARMTEAILIAISLAAGAGIVIKLWDMLGGVVL